MKRLRWLILLALVFLPPLSALAAYQEVQGYTVVDEYTPVRLAVGEHLINFASTHGGETVYAYKDLGEDYFSSNLTILFEFKLTGFTPSCGIELISISDYIGTQKYGTDSANFSIGVKVERADSPNNIYLKPFEMHAGNVQTQSDYFEPALNTVYYCTFLRDVSYGTYGSITLKVYSDNARLAILDTITGTLHSDKDFDLLFMPRSYGNSLLHAPDYMSGYVGMVTIVPEQVTGAIPPVIYDPGTNTWVDGTWDPDHGWWYACVGGVLWIWVPNVSTEWQEYGACGNPGIPSFDPDHPGDYINDWLDKFGDGFRVLVVLVGMVIGFGWLSSRGAPRWLQASVPAVILIAGIVSGWVPAWLTLLMGVIVGLVLWKMVDR